MALNAKFTKGSIQKMMEERVAMIRTAVVDRLKILGEMCVIEARTNKTYMDQTGNLTSSMGYIVVDHGKVVQQAGFQGTQKGMITGKSIANSLANKHPNAFALYVVAGMNYAAYVEARGYNVLASAELVAEKELPKMMKQLIDGINKMN